MLCNRCEVMLNHSWAKTFRTGYSFEVFHHCAHMFKGCNSVIVSIYKMDTVCIHDGDQSLCKGTWMHTFLCSNLRQVSKFLPALVDLNTCVGRFGQFSIFAELLGKYFATFKLWYITKIHLWTMCRVNDSRTKVCFAKNVPVHLISFEKHLQTTFCGFMLMMSIYYEYYIAHCLLTQACPIWCSPWGREVPIKLSLIERIHWVHPNLSNGSTSLGCFPPWCLMMRTDSVSETLCISNTPENGWCLV